MQHHLPTELRRAVRVALFNDASIRAVAQDPPITPLATILIIVSSFAGALGSYVFPISVGIVQYRPTLLEALFSGVGAVFWVVIALFILNWISDRLFMGKGTFQSFLRVVGYGYVVGLLGFFPLLSVVVGLWMVAVVFKALMITKGLNWEKSALVLLFTVVIMMTLFSLLGEVTPAHLYGGLYVAPY